MAHAGQRDGIDHTVTPQRRETAFAELHVKEAEVKPRVVCNQRRIGEESQQFLRFGGKQGLVGEEGIAEPVNRLGSRGHRPLGIEIGVKSSTRFDPVDHFDATNFHQPVAALRIEAGGFGVKNHFTHCIGYRSLVIGKQVPGRGLFVPHRAGISFSTSRATDALVSGSGHPVSMT